MPLLKKKNNESPEQIVEEKLEKELNRSNTRSARIKSSLQDILKFFSLIQVVLGSILLGGLFGGYIYYMTNNIKIGLVMLIVSGFFGFYFGMYIPKKIAHKQNLMRDLQRYATNMTFYLSTGYNVVDSLRAAQKQLDNEIAEDIELTIVGLEKKAILFTDHFKKYHFDAIDIFHEVLAVYYENGGNPREMFNKPNKAINFELVKSDELYRRKQNHRKSLYFMALTSASMPLIVRIMTKDIYDEFLSVGIPSYIACIIYCLGTLHVLYQIQKNAKDIAVY